MLAGAQTNLALLNSPEGDYIGQGQLYYTTNTADFTVGLYGSTPWAIQAAAFGYVIMFGGPNDTVPSVGVYSNAVGWPSSGSSPSLSVFGNGRGCSTLCGSFQIFELHTNATGAIDRFWATFSQKLYCNNPPLTGEIRYRSLLAPATPLSRILRVPSDFPTIQSALNNANSMSLDTVLVDPGLYNEALQFGNARAQLLSANGPTATYLAATGSVAITFEGSTPDTLVSGFTLMDSSTGIFISNGGSPTIVSNAIVNCGTGIDCDSGSVDLQGSPIIRSNTITGCSGGAVQLSFAGTPLVEGNSLEDNGGGIGMWEAGSPTIRNNIIRRNHGDGMSMANDSNADIVQNLIVENDGDGVAWTSPVGARGPWLVNNTIIANGGAGIASGSYDGGAEIINNIVVGNPALTVGAYVVPLIQYNDIYSPTGAAYVGIGDLTGVDGNISADPFVVCQPGGDFRLFTGSPCIDAGTDGAPLLPATDFNGQPRTLPGHTSGAAVVDMGAFEFNLAALPPPLCPFLYCPANVVAIASAGQNSAQVTYPAPFATPGATVTNFPPSGSVFPEGTNTVTSTAVSGTNVLTCAFTVTVLVPPTVTSQPQGTIVSAGTPTNLTVAASGSAPLQYQWTFEGIPIALATNSILALSNPQSSNEGYYRVTITNAAGSTTSAAALLRVLPAAPSILAGPTSLTVSAGSNAPFSVTAAGNTPMWFQWLRGSAPILGATASQLVVSNAQAGDSGSYQVVVSNLLGMATSASATLNVLPAKPAFTLQPVGAAIAMGSNFTMRCLAAGTEPLAYQWRRNATNISGATQTSLTISNVNTGSNGSYTVVATNTLGGTTSAVAYVSVYGTPPAFTQQPASIEVLEGSSVTLNSLATGNTPLSYQWCFYGTNLPGKTSRQLILTSVTPASAGPYFVVATNAYGATNSATAQLTVNESIVLVQPLTNQVVDAGSTVFLSVGVNGTGLLSYSWALNGLPIPGTNAWLALTNIQRVQSGYYQFTVANQYGSRSCTGRVSVFGSHSAVVAWGDNSGNQTNVPSSLNDAVAVAGGDYHTLALRHSGSLLAWGYNGDGQTNAPVNPLRFVSISAGSAHNLAVAEDGSLVAWGRNDSGQCSVPASATMVLAPAAGDSHSLALLASGTVLAWGDNSFGQTAVPQGLTGVRAIAAGREHNVALRNNGSVIGWGLNSYGQASPPTSLSGVAGIAAGYLHSVALLSNGTVVVWGDNTYGQTNVPSNLTNAVAVAAGDFHTLALCADGSIIGWGNNWFGQTVIPSLAENAADIACGYYHCLALSPAPRLLASPAANGLVIHWSGPGTLQWAPAPLGPYTDLPGCLQCYTNTACSQPAKYFRVRR
jgi:parallel beta-helix repeat protein